MASSASTASSQILLDSLVGSFKTPATREIPPPVSSYAEPLSLSGLAWEKRPAADAGGPWVAYCVRLCDGRFFPLQRSFAVSPAEQCRSFCPAAKTKILGGNSINHAMAADGTRYANLENAFLYRKRVVENCTCNGRDAFGLARLDVASDPTLRAGDIVAINGGFAASTGSKPTRLASGLTPIERYPGLSNDLRRRLSQTMVLPSRRTPQPTAAIADAARLENMLTRREDRRVQLFR